MNLSKSSWHSQLYQLMYGWGKLPNNLCPYFWKLIAATIFLVPVVVIIAPFLLIERTANLFEKTKESFSESHCEGIFSFMHLAAGILAYGALFAVYAMFFSWFTSDESGQLVGVLFWVIAAVVGVVNLCRWYSGRSAPTKRSSQPNILAEFIKAKYNKYCPKINWK